VIFETVIFDCEKGEQTMNEHQETTIGERAELRGAQKQTEAEDLFGTVGLAGSRAPLEPGHLPVFVSPDQGQPVPVYYVVRVTNSTD
jgi:hypothetical protein